MAQTLIDDILYAREKNKSEKDYSPAEVFSVTEIVKNHIPLNTELQSALHTLKENKFKIQTLEKLTREKKQYDQIYQAVYDPRKWYWFGFGDVVTITLYVNQGKVQNISGSIKYMAL